MKAAIPHGEILIFSWILAATWIFSTTASSGELPEDGAKEKLPPEAQKAALDFDSGTIGDGRVIDLGGDVEWVLRYIPQGEFTAVIARQTHDDRVHEAMMKPETKLLSHFWMGESEVTQAQWVAVMGEDSHWSLHTGNDLPVQRLEPVHLVEFFRRMNNHPQRPEGWYFSLPTQIEWDWASLGGATSWPTQDALNAHAWFAQNSAGEVRPVKQLHPNGYGLHDMLGNVWEACHAFEGIREVAVEANPYEWSEYLLRGGGWDNGAEKIDRKVFRFWDQGFPRDGVGFRVVLVNVKPVPPAVDNRSLQRDAGHLIALREPPPAWSVNPADELRELIGADPVETKLLVGERWKLRLLVPGDTKISVLSGPGSAIANDLQVTDLEIREDWLRKLPDWKPTRQPDPQTTLWNTCRLRVIHFPDPDRRAAWVDVDGAPGRFPVVRFHGDELRDLYRFLGEVTDGRREAISRFEHWGTSASIIPHGQPSPHVFMKWLWGGDVGVDCIAPAHFITADGNAGGFESHVIYGQDSSFNPNYSIFALDRAKGIAVYLTLDLHDFRSIQKIGGSIGYNPDVKQAVSNFDLLRSNCEREGFEEPAKAIRIARAMLRSLEISDTTR